MSFQMDGVQIMKQHMLNSFICSAEVFFISLHSLEGSTHMLIHGENMSENNWLAE